MSLENEDGSSTVEVIESVTESEKKQRISYARDFLISLSDLEICKKLPSSCDQSVLSELEESTKTEQPRTHGGLPLQGFRRNDYSSSPPTRGDSRGYGKWDNRSSGWSDKDGDSQSDLDQDSGRRGFGNQSRRPRQNSEHDGLLGSGSFSRPSGFTAGTSAPKGPTNEPHHLNRSNEPYQPPRPYKAVPHSRPNTHDSFNDETFGSSESTSQDRAEEERKRRASFELMRKEQQKVLHEKQKVSGNRLKNDEFTDLLTEETKESGLESNSAVQSVPNDDSGKSSSLLQSSKPRPLVPPGFKSTKLISSIDKEQDPKPGIVEMNSLAQNGSVDNQVMGIAGFQDAGSTDFVEQKSKQDEHLSPSNGQSSRFAQWFNDDEMKPVDDRSSNRPNDLLSLIGGGPTKIPSDSKELYNSFTHESAPPVAAVLTCEDLEQTILSQYSEKVPTLQPPIREWSVSGQENSDAIIVDNRATNHLLSLLQKGPANENDNDNTSNTNLQLMADSPEKSKDANREADAGQSLSLESLFGTAFMKELQSAQAPVSARMHIFEPHELSGPLSFDGIDSNMKQPAKSNEVESWSNFGGQRVDYNPLELQVGISKSGKQAIGTGVIDDSLMMVNDLANTHNQTMGKPLPSDVPFNISDKLAGLNSGFIGGQEGSRFVRGPYDMLEPERQFNNNNNNLHGQASSPQNRRPTMFHPLDRMNSQMKYPEHHLNQQFSNRPFHHPDARVTGFDVEDNNLQTRMQRNLLTPQLLREFSRPLQHSGNQTPNFMPDREAIHGLPFAHQQTVVGGLGMQLPVANGSSGGNHPEAFQRLMEMELRAQSQQHNQGVFGGPELDMGYRYR